MFSSLGRYSVFIRPLLYITDLAIVLLLAVFFLQLQNDILVFFLFIIISWVVTTMSIGFYEVYRFTPLIKIVYLLIKQLIIFTVLIFSFFGFFNDERPELEQVLIYVSLSFLGITLFKIGIFNLLKKYRTLLGKNVKRVIILGQNSKTLRLKRFFDKNPAYGYKTIEIFNFRNDETSIDEIVDYVKNNNIDEIYCSISELDNKKTARIIDFAENNLKIIKFLPDNKEIFTKKLQYQYYGITPILSLRTIPLESALNQLLKRFLDIFVSLFVVVALLSWLIPLLAIIIKLDSKGPVFFRQRRNGLDYEEFYCYKFRSMYPNKDADIHQIKKCDERVTKIGKFLRKTSIDELPQFFNVLIGDMSVVGPRPHMVSHTHIYASSIDKFMVRHLIKPGITGLAQVSGYRGEVENDNDIVNRVRFDIFYLENWSILMDLRIMAKTIVNTLKGDAKAY